jgi:predicted nucleic acid-binding protein
MLGSKTPDNTGIYIDTSVLVKWYVKEPYSDEVEAFLNQNSPLLLSDLVVLEWHCALRRIERNGVISKEYQLTAERELVKDIAGSWFSLVSCSAQLMKNAQGLIEQVSPLSLRALDAMHLTIAQSAQIQQLATADKEMRKAAESLDFITYYFND